MTSLTYNRRGFTFTEVMFAVILLGIGFIMLAGMFPVAIQQTQTNVEESTGSTIVQAARHYLEQTMTVDDMLPTGNLDPTKGPVVSPRFLRLSEYHDVPTGNPLLNGYLWEKVRGGFILSQDPRYAWTALYKRNPGDNFAHVIIFALQARNYSTYDSNDTVRYPVAGSGPLLASLEPRFIHAYLSDGGRPGEADIIEFFGIGNDGLIRDGPNGPQSD